MADYILSIDEGTTSVRVLVMDTNLNLVAEQGVPFEQYFPKPGWVEHDLNEIWSATLQAIDAISKKVDLKKIIAIGITNQRETLCFWNKKTVVPICRALVWQDRRTADRCAQLVSQGKEPRIQNITGLVVDPYFSGTKLEWVLKNNTDVSKMAATGELAVGTIESFLLAKLTGGLVHATEASNASRTLLFDITKLNWSDDLLQEFGVSRAILPEVKQTFSRFGVTKGVRGLPDGVPITGMIGDQQSALLGQACLDVGQAKCTFGTGAFLLMNTGHDLIRSKARLLTTIAWFDGVKPVYALEGSAFMAGATIQWLRDGLKMISSSAEINILAEEVQDSGGVTFVPAFTGMGAPYWDPNARALISGLTRGTTRSHIARAALEGIAFQNVDLLQAMEKDLGHPLKQLNVDGGASRSDLLMQIQSDLLGCDLHRPQVIETTALGAVFAAGVGVGVWSTLSDVKKSWKLDRIFQPTVPALERDSRLKSWRHEVMRARQ